MTKESYKAWMKMQHYVYEINLCIEHQIGWKNVWDNNISLLPIFDKVIDDLISQSDQFQSQHIKWR